MATVEEIIAMLPRPLEEYETLHWHGFGQTYRVWAWDPPNTYKRNELVGGINAHMLACLLEIHKARRKLLGLA